MTITYDPQTKRATHIESGMWVEYLREGNYAGLECDAYLRMGWNGQVKDFQASYDSGEDKFKKLYPDLDPFELAMKISNLKERNYNISDNGFNVALERTSNPEFPQIFVELVQVAASNRLISWRCSAYFRPFLYLTDGQWSAEG
jgi:hypothetical protein